MILQSKVVRHGTSGDGVSVNPRSMRVEMERNVPVAFRVADRKEMTYPGASPLPASRQPETGSLNALLREHSRERLYVRTIAWTGRQVRMLNMAFEKTDADATTQGTHQEPDDEGGGCLDGEQPSANEYRCMKSNTVRTIRAIETLMKECVEKQVGECAEMQKAAMRTLLSEFGFKLAGKGSVGEPGFRYVDNNGLTKAGRAEFQFGKKTVDTVRPDAVFETNSRGLQLVAYANFETISNSRKRYSRGKAKKLQRIEPADAREDPYIASMLIALAQHQRRLAGSREERVDVGGERVTVLGIPGPAAKELYVYTTRIPEEFLVKLERPSQRSDCDRVVICHHSISLREPQRAASRLWLALLRNSPIPEDPHQAKQLMRGN